MATSRAKVAAALNRLLHEDQDARDGCRKPAEAEHASSACPPFDNSPPEVPHCVCVLPRGDEPLDSYQAAYWPACFPVLFPYGDACDGIMRITPLQDLHWVRSLLERADRVMHGVWRTHLDFVAVCYSTMHRRQMLRSIRARVRTPAFKKEVSTLLKTTSVNWGAVADIIGERGGLKEALLSERVDSDVKTLLRSMQLTQMKIPCTDGYRTNMRHQMRSLQIWAGLPLLFFTLNPADVKHPFTLFLLDSRIFLGISAVAAVRRAVAGDACEGELIRDCRQRPSGCSESFRDARAALLRSAPWVLLYSIPVELRRHCSAHRWWWPLR